MNPPINITNYDKRRSNSERGGNLGLADLILEELKQYFLGGRRPWVFVNILKTSSTLPSCNVVFTFLSHLTTFEVVIDKIKSHIGRQGMANNSY